MFQDRLQKFRFNHNASSPTSRSPVKSSEAHTKVKTSSLISSPLSASQSIAGAESGGQLVSSQEDFALSGASQASLTPSEDKLLREANEGADNEDLQPNKKKRKRQDAKPEVFDKDLKGLPERLGEKPLRAIIVGTNPSGHAWRSGHYYSNPNNHMWKILRQTGIAPASIAGSQDDYRMPEEAGIGFVDVGCGIPGTHLHKFSSEIMQGWGSGFFIRLTAHVRRANEFLGCTCGGCGAPKFICYAGKRQWMELLNTGKKGKEKISKIEQGRQVLRPQGWPLPSSTEVWVLPSTSGAAAMTVEERVGPYRDMAARLAAVPWPLSRAKCQSVQTECLKLKDS